MLSIAAAERTTVAPDRRDRTGAVGHRAAAAQAASDFAGRSLRERRACPAALPRNFDHQAERAARPMWLGQVRALAIGRRSSGPGIARACRQFAAAARAASDSGRRGLPEN